MFFLNCLLKIININPQMDNREQASTSKQAEEAEKRMEKPASENGPPRQLVVIIKFLSNCYLFLASKYYDTKYLAFV